MLSLTRFRIEGKVLGWLRSFLCGRSQRVAVSGSMVSRDRPLLFGVPQGSVLGPVLFTLYVAPLEDIIVKHGCQTVIFADDTQLYISCDTSNCVSKIETCVDEIRKWMNGNFLAMNDSKTEIIHFTSKFHSSVAQSAEYLVRVGDINISPTNVVRNLGVKFDRFATMSDHISSVCKAASYSLWRIGKIRHLLDRQNTEKLVHAFLTCKLDYCNSLLFGISDYQIYEKVTNNTKFSCTPCL